MNFAILLLFIFKHFSETVSITGKTSFGTSFLLGLIITIVFPIASIILLITFIGIPLGIIGLSISALVMLFGALFANLIVGGFVFRLFSKNNPHRNATWQIAIIGSKS